MKLKTFNEFVTENTEETNRKVQFLRLVPIRSYTDNKSLITLTEKAAERFYEEYILQEYEGNYTSLRESLKDDRPILYYGSKSGSTSKFINEYISKNENLVYNRPSEQEKSGDKVKFHQTLEGTNLTPKTVFSVKEAKDLKYPIIAKPAEGMSGKGIEKFETFEDLQKSDGNFDLYSEFVDFDREFRGLFVKDKMAVVFERIPVIEDNKTVSTKKRDEKLSFVYLEQDLLSLKFIPKLREMTRKFNENIDLDVFSLDFFLEKDGNLSLIEANASSGLGANSLVSIYECLYNDFYKEEMTKEDKEFRKFIKDNYNMAIKLEYPEEYKNSLSPK